MNKLIQVNIGGLVFQIDEGAYLKLDKYLSSIKRKYEKEEGGKEIISDIELRIAEVFNENAELGKAIMMEDVDRIIEMMGQPEDFEEASDEEVYSERETKRSRRFFRDGENRMLGGVCSGFGAYFDIDPLWIRLAFVAAFFFGGSGLLLYIVLWIIMPEAKTTTEKLEMKGERVTISNIERSIKGGARQFTDKTNEMGREIRETFSDGKVRKAGNSIGEALENIVDSIKPIVRVFFKVFVLGIVVACLAMLVIICVGLLTDVGRIGGQVDFVKTHIFEQALHGNIMLFSGIAIIGIPLLVLIVRGVKYLLNVRYSFKAFDWTMLFLWVVCIVGVFVVGVQLANDFSTDIRLSEQVRIEEPSNELLMVKMQENTDHDIFHTYYWKKDWDNELVFHEDTIYNRDIDFSIVKADDSLYTLTVIKSARGDSRDKARNRSKAVSYPVIQEDSVLLFPSSINLGEKELWRNQKVDLILRVPQQKMIVIDRQLDDFFRYNDMTENMDHDDLFNTRLIMTGTGLHPVY